MQQGKTHLRYTVKGLSGVYDIGSSQYLLYQQAGGKFSAAHPHSDKRAEKQHTSIRHLQNSASKQKGRHHDRVIPILV